MDMMDLDEPSITLLEHPNKAPLRRSYFLAFPDSTRHRIYAFYFASLPTTFSPPPIALVNRQIRKETLRQFYGSSRFSLPLCQTLSGELLLENPFDQAFFERAPQKYVAMIKHLHVPISLRSKSMKLQVDCSEWEIDFSTVWSPGAVRRVKTSCDEEDEYTMKPNAIDKNLSARVRMLGSTRSADKFASFFRARGNRIRDW